MAITPPITITVTGQNAIGIAYSPGITDAPTDGGYYARHNAAWAALGSMALVADAPSDGTDYVRRNGAWASLGSTPGTVTSVGLSLPADFTVSNSPVTTSGTLTAAWANQAAGAFLAGPASGPNAAPTWRAIASSDLTTALATPPAIGGTTPAAVAATTLSATGQITSTLATGTAPLSITSTTQVPNLYVARAALADNASQLLGATWAAPAAIGGTTPAAGTFSTLTVSAAASPQIEFTVNGTNTARIYCTSTQGFNFNDQVNNTTPLIYSSGTSSTGYWIFGTSTPSTAYTNGAVVIQGGLGVTGQINTASIITGLGLSLGASPTAAATGIIYLSRTSGPNLAFQISGTTGAQLRLTSANILSITDPTGGVIGLSVDNVNSVVAVPYSTASTSATTGALVVAGGIGIGGAFSAGALSKVTCAGSGQLSLISSTANGQLNLIPSSGLTFSIGSNGVNFYVFDGTTSVAQLGSFSATFTQRAASSGALAAWTFNTGASTGQTASTEVNGINFNMSATRTWAAGGIGTQREVLIQAPIYAFASASTITTAATLAITGAPAAGTNATITNPWAFLISSGGMNVASGVSKFGGIVQATSTTTLQLLQGPATSGTPVVLFATGGAHTTLTPGTEAPDFNINLARTVQWATTVPTTQRAFLVQAPTYACDTAGQTITTAATLAISGPPIAGTNVAITSGYALWVQSGQATLAGGCVVNGVYGLHISQTASSVVNPVAFQVISAANTNLAASTEVFAAQFNMSATVQFATGALATQRAAVFQAPTYSFVAASTITTAATVAITGAPSAGANATITNSFALWVQGGTVRFDANLSMNSTFILNDGFNIIVGSSTGAKIGTATTQKLGFWNATPIVQPSGYGTPTGASQTANFPGASATLAQTSAQLAQLLTDLKATGILGA